MKPASILIVEDDEKTAATIRLYLENAGFLASIAMDGAEALQAVHLQSPDLLILDLMLPKVDGLTLCHQLRQFSEVPVILLTARTEEEDKLRGLQSGADDYVTKPFSPRELIARVKAVLRRTRKSGEKEQKQFDCGDLHIDFERHEVRVRGSLVPLTPTEFRLLEIFSRAPERVFSRQELLERAFDSDFEGLDRTVDAHIMNLRKKIESDRSQPSRIVTVFGLGYKFSAGSNVP
ncbi:response regulator transcription factor [bacterium]|nr:response regulator transcription factor [bacterium]MCI0605845.1 response regulator transcription factor [bacterium]